MFWFVLSCDITTTRVSLWNVLAIWFIEEQQCFHQLPGVAPPCGQTMVIAIPFFVVCNWFILAKQQSDTAAAASASPARGAAVPAV